MENEIQTQVLRLIIDFLIDEFGATTDLTEISELLEDAE